MSSIASQMVAARMQAVFSGVRANLDTITSSTGLTFQGFLVKSSVEQSANSEALSLASALSMDTENNEKVIGMLTDMLKETTESNKATASASVAETAATEPDVSAMSLLPATDYDGFIIEAAEAYCLEPALIKALMYAESGFRADASSDAGAMGLMQLMPHTAEALAVEDPYDPASNIDGGARLLSSLLDRYEGDARMAVAAYNLGAAGLDAYELDDLTDSSQWARLPAETRALLSRLGDYLSGAGAGGVWDAPLLP